MTPQGPELQPHGYLTHSLCVDSQSQHFRTRYASPKVIGGRVGAHTAFEVLSASRGAAAFKTFMDVPPRRLKRCHGILLRLLRICGCRPLLLSLGSPHVTSAPEVPGPTEAGTRRQRLPAAPSTCERVCASPGYLRPGSPGQNLRDATIYGPGPTFSTCARAEAWPVGDPSVGWRGAVQKRRAQLG